MKISELIEGNTIEGSSSDTSINLEEVEKTAELLVALSEKDTLIDDLARLAVLQDMTKDGALLDPKSWEWVNNRRVLKSAKNKLKGAERSQRVAEVNVETAKVRAETANIKRKVETLENPGKSLPISEMITPAAVGIGIGAVGTGVYFKEREKQLMSEYDKYLASLQMQHARNK